MSEELSNLVNEAMDIEFKLTSLGFNISHIEQLKLSYLEKVIKKGDAETQEIIEAYQNYVEHLKDNLYILEVEK